MAVEVEGNVKCSVAFFMEELQRYESLNNKFSKDYKQVRDNCWLAMGKKFNMAAEEAEKKYKSIRSSYGRWLWKVKKIPSGSGRDAVSFADDYANLGSLEQHIGHRTRSSNFSRADSDDSNESQSPETEGKENEQDAESDFVEGQVDVIKVTIDNGGDLEKKPVKKTEKKKATPAATPKTRQPWAADSKTIFPKDSVDLAMVQIADRVLQSPTDNKSEDDEDSLFGRIFAKRMKKLAPKTKRLCAWDCRSSSFCFNLSLGQAQLTSPWNGFQSYWLNTPVPTLTVDGLSK